MQFRRLTSTNYRLTHLTLETMTCSHHVIPPTDTPPANTTLNLTKLKQDYQIWKMMMLADQCQTVVQPKNGAKTADINPTKPRTENAQPQGNVVMIH